MKVIVKVAGFYAGVWRNQGEEVEMIDKVAKPFLPPYGDQLAVPAAKRAAPRSEKSGSQASE